MAKKCKILKTIAETNTVVFDLDGVESFIIGDYIDCKGYVFIENKDGVFVSVDEPKDVAPKKKDKKVE